MANFFKYIAFIMLIILSNVSHARASIEVKVEHHANRSMIIFPWKEEVNASVFLRDDHLWIIFDKSADIQFIRNAGNDFSNGITKLEQKKKLNRNASFIHAKLHNPHSEKITTYRYRNTWIVEITNSENEVQGIKVISQALHNNQPRVLISAEEKKQSIIEYTDPFFQDRMAVIPYHSSGLAIHSDYSYIDFNLLKTIQGVAIQKIADGLHINKEDTFFAITSQYGLNISTRPYSGVKNLSVYPLTSSDGLSLLPSKIYQSNNDFMEDMAAIKQRIYSHKDEQALNYAKLALFYLANSWKAESYDAISMAIGKQDSSMVYDDQLKLIRAVIYYMQNKYNSAGNELRELGLNYLEVKNRDEVRFWQNLNLYMLNDFHDRYSYNKLLQTLKNKKNNFLSKYSTNIIAEIILDIAEQSLHTDTDISIKDILPMLDKIPLEYTAGRINKIMAEYYANQGREQNALDYWNKCEADFNNFESRVYCLFEHTEYLINSGTLEYSEYIDNLEYIAVLARDHALEKKVLDMLGKAYYKHSDYPDAMRVWSELLDIYPNSYEAIEISGRMNRTFSDFFRMDKLSEMSPFKIARFFFNFRQWMPIGKEGDTISLQLVTYLVDLDLIDSAMNLLSHQIKNKLSHLHKERAINRLMGIALLDDQPQKALNILKYSASSIKLPHTLVSERTYLKVQALAGIGKEYEAIGLIKDDFSPKADLIKSQIFWKLNDWKSFNDYSEPQIYLLSKTTGVLDEADALKVVKQGLSYMMLGKTNLLEKLYYNFSGKIPQTSQVKDIFELFRVSFTDDISVESLQQSIDSVKAVINNINK